MTLPRIARGDAIVFPPLPLPSPLPSVSSEAWSKFFQALCVQDREDETPRGLGCFAMRPRRLGDLGLMQNLRTVPSTGQKRQVWIGDFVPPLTREKFLGSPLVQYNALIRSVTRHAEDLRDTRLPEGVSRSGALAILHAAGPGALRSWAKGPHFQDTVEVLKRANGIF